MSTDQREQEMLELMRECSMTLRRCETQLNEIWAEWTRTHGLKGIPGKEKPSYNPPAQSVVRRVVKR
ncbi:MAG TPA: hypothetical protein VFI41_04990 [Gemmatimonadales bacterium]|nr:hypothetical protein [Gemmatimonadales bacterium]